MEKKSITQTALGILIQRLSNLTFLKIALYLFVFAILAKGVITFTGKIPSDNELFSLKGEIHSIFLGGDGKSTWLYIQSGDSLRIYRSFFGKVWPGMEFLKKGDTVNITAWSENRSTYIWQLTKGSEIIIQPKDVRELVEKSITDKSTFADRSMLFSIILLAIAYIRHLIIRPTKC